MPEFVPRGWWAKLLHGQAGVVLLLRLRYLPGVAVTNIPYHIQAYVKHEAEPERVAISHHHPYAAPSEA